MFVTRLLLVLAALLFGVRPLPGQSLGEDAPAESDGGGVAERRVLPTPVPVKPNNRESTVDWRGVMQQSAFFTGIQHAFRLGTEPGTRSGMKGPFFPDYAHAVGNMHGWGDGDPFYVNYVGHPLQGAASGFIYLQNDSQARLQRFGRDPRYWRSRLKAMGFAWAYSTWFEIGPISEASIGNVQSYRPQQGFVDHAVTPLIGTGWLIVEDFFDEKLILPLERRFDNRIAKLMVRSWLNPSRSWANMMRFKVPWYRDNRGGVLPGRYRDVYVMQPESLREFPKAAPFELSVIPFWTRFDGTQCAGGGGQGAYRLSNSLQVVGQLSGCSLRDQPANVSGDSLTYSIGPRWTPLAERRVSPYAQLLVGGNKLTRYEIDPIRERILKADALRKGLEPPPAETYTTASHAHGWALNAGAGVDVRLNPAFALRLASVEYARSWAPNSNPAFPARAYNKGVQLSTGVILRVGTW